MTEYFFYAISLLKEMDKKDIYEHLAKIYLDASPKGNKSTTSRNNFLRLRFLVGGIAILFFVFATFFILRYKPKVKTEVALVINPNLVRINFHFDPAKKEVYSLDLDKLDLSKYRALAFEIWRSQFEDNVSLRVEVTNAFKETSEFYLKDIPHKPTFYKIPLVEFRKISDWTEMTSLAFIIEEWNTKDKRGVIFVDNVRFLR